VANFGIGLALCDNYRGFTLISTNWVAGNESQSQNVLQIY